MKKLSTLLIIAFAMVLGLTQCKKKVDTIATPSDLGKTVHITVNVGGDKHIVYPGTGAVVYGNGDKIYVGNNGTYVGTLTYADGKFSGTIYGPETTDYLHFYFLGGLTPSATPEAGTTANFTVNIADQSSNLPVLSYAHSTQKYVDGTTTYDCTLLNKCGLVKFVPAIATSETVKVDGMTTTAKIDFATPGITPTAATGEVTLYSESNDAKWAILLVQNAVTNPTVTIAGYNSTITSVPAVTENMYYTDGVDIEMEEVSPSYIDADFTVAQGTTVKFSKGNLQYNKTTGKFSFMEHQYSTVETDGQDVGDDYANQNIVSLFGWGTSGWDNGNYFYQPYNTTTSVDPPYTQNNGFGYGPTDGSTYTYSLTGDYANADWGVYNKQSNQNKIENGGDHAWRTLTKDEWVYLFDTRSNTTVNGTSNARFTKAAITTPSKGTVNGVIIFPDSYSGGTPAGVTWGTINGKGNGFTTTCNAAGWAALESAGCVFLPAAGGRGISSVVYWAGSEGFYWSSTYYQSYNAYNAGFNNLGLGGQYNGSRSNGYSVRLVF